MDSSNLFFIVFLFCFLTFVIGFPYPDWPILTKDHLCNSVISLWLGPPVNHPQSFFPTHISKTVARCAPMPFLLVPAPWYQLEQLCILLCVTLLLEQKTCSPLAPCPPHFPSSAVFSQRSTLLSDPVTWESLQPKPNTDSLSQDALDLLCIPAGFH